MLTLTGCDGFLRVCAVWGVEPCVPDLREYPNVSQVLREAPSRNIKHRYTAWVCEAFLQKMCIPV